MGLTHVPNRSFLCSCVASLPRAAVHWELLQPGSFPQAAAWISASPWSSPWAAGQSLLHRGLVPRLQGNICSGAGSASSPSCFSLPGAHTADSHFFSPQPSALPAVLPFLNYVFTEAPPTWLTGPVLSLRWACWSQLEPAGTRPPLLTDPPQPPAAAISPGPAGTRTYTFAWLSSLV